MPELPDLTVYIEALRRHAAGHPVARLRLPSFTLLRTYDPSPQEAVGRRLVGASLLGKQIALAFEDELVFVLHLMIAGRLRWKKPGAAIPGKVGHMAIDFPHGTLLLTEQGSKKRATLHVVRGAAALAAFDRGGLDPLAATPEEFTVAIRRENRTLKRALTDPRTVTGIGNAYSDEILHRARLSPLTWTSRLSEADLLRLRDATREVLEEWTRRLRAEVGEGFPDTVTAFREGMAVHGRFGQPCPVCGAPVQRIVRAENEVNYCPGCQTGGTILADRSLSRLLKDDWPRTVEEWEALPGHRPSR